MATRRRPIQVYRFNTGSCGGCDLEIIAAIAAADDIAWAATPQEADVLLVTGPLTYSIKGVLAAHVQGLSQIPVLIVGRCAIDGHPFGRGGVASVAELTVQRSLDGCPPNGAQILAAVRDLALRETTT